MRKIIINNCRKIKMWLVKKNCEQQNIIFFVEFVDDYFFNEEVCFLKNGL